MKSYNLQWYVDKLKRGEKFSLARYGDGEMLCMWGKEGGNSNGCRYSPELREALLDSMKHKNDPSFIYGMQRVLPKDRERIEKEYPDVDWHDSEIFGEAAAAGKLFPFIEQLRKMDVVIVGNKSIEKFAKDILVADFIEVPSFNAYDEKDKILFKIGHFQRTDKNNVVLFSCGMAANAFVDQLHYEGQYNWYIDVGHIWDPFVGNMSRCDLEGKTMEEIEKNLKPYEEN